MARSKSKKRRSKKSWRVKNQIRRARYAKRSLHYRETNPRQKKQTFKSNTKNRWEDKEPNSPTAHYNPNFIPFNFTAYYSKHNDIRLKVCRRRKQRRSILFAQKKAGTGQTAKPKYTQRSKISC